MVTIPKPITKQVGQAPVDREGPKPNPGGRDLSREIEVPLSAYPRPLDPDGPTASERHAYSAQTMIHKNYTLLSNAAKDTADADLDGLSGQALTLMGETGDFVQRQINAIDANIDGLEKQIAAKITAPCDVGLATEYRNYMRRPNKDGKMRSQAGMLAEGLALVQEDKRFVNAILTVPPRILGLSQENADLFRVQAVHSYAPGEKVDLDRATKAKSQLHASMTQFAEDIGGRIGGWVKRPTEAQTALKKATGAK